MDTYGWQPEGGGVMLLKTAGSAQLTGVAMQERGLPERVFGTAVGCNLPSHIPQRMANRALNLLESQLEVPLDIRPQRTRSLSTGAGIFLTVEYTNGRGGFGCIGRQGMPSEVVAERAITDLLNFHTSGAAVDHHLADQLVLPLALADGASAICTDRITSHCRTAIDVVRAFIDRPILLDEQARTITFAVS
jgi:RNA 3'-terminal phosphate cyclase (ATP)